MTPGRTETRLRLWLVSLTRLDLQRSQPSPIHPLEALVSILILPSIILFTKKFCGRTRRTPSTSRGNEISQSNPSILRCGVGSPMMKHPSPTERKKHWSHPPSPRCSAHPSIPSDNADRSELGGTKSKNPPRCSVQNRRPRSTVLVQRQEGA